MDIFLWSALVVKGFGIKNCVADSHTSYFYKFFIVIAINLVGLQRNIKMLSREPIVFSYCNGRQQMLLWFEQHCKCTLKRTAKNNVEYSKTAKIFCKNCRLAL